MCWIAVVTLLSASFLHGAGASNSNSIFYVDDEPAISFHYTTDQPANDNWIGVWKADDEIWKEDEAARQKGSSVAWNYAQGIEGEVHLSINTAGKYKACLFSLSSSSTPHTLAGPEEFELASYTPCSAAANACSDGEKECFDECISSADFCNGGAFGVCPWTRPSIWQGGLCCNGGADGTQGGDNCTPQIPPCNPKLGKECFGRCISKDDFCNGGAFGVCPSTRPSIWQGGLCCNGGADGTQGGDNCTPQMPPCNPKLGKECFGKCISKDDFCISDAFGVCPSTRPSVWQGGLCCNGGTDGTQGGDNCTPQMPPCNPKSAQECFGKCISKDDVCNGYAFGVCPWTRPSVWQGGLCCNGGTDGTRGGDNCSPQIPPCNPKSGRECSGKCISKDAKC